MRYIITIIFVLLSNSASSAEPIVWPEGWGLSVLGGLQSKAYPGIAYETRIGVTGGQFPYQYTLPNDKGLVIDKNTGEITWVPSLSQQGINNFSVAITDSKNTTINYDFSVDVTTEGFLFVEKSKGIDSNGVNGSVSNPFESLKYAVSISASNDIIYMRGGKYNESAIGFSNSTSTIVLAYPGETPEINLNDGRALNYNNASKLGIFKGLKIFNCMPKCIYVERSSDLLIYKNIFDDALDVGNSENPSFIYFAGHKKSSARHSFVRILNNKFSNFKNVGSETDGAAVSFDVQNSLFADNHLSNMGNYGFADKDNTKRNVYRKNFITGTRVAGIGLKAQAGSSEIAVHHNLLVDSGRIYICERGPCSKFYIHHNTFYNTNMAFHAGFGNGGPTAHIAYNILFIPDSSGVWPYRYNQYGRPPVDEALLSADVRIDNNILFFSNKNILGAPVGGNRKLYSKNEWQTTYLKDVNSLFLDPELTGSGQQLGLSTSSPYFGIYGHQYDNAEVGGVSPSPGAGAPQKSTPNPPRNFRVISR